MRDFSTFWCDLYSSAASIQRQRTAWCSEIGSLTSWDACNSGASSDRRGPISLHQAVYAMSSVYEIPEGDMQHCNTYSEKRNIVIAIQLFQT